MLLNNKSQVFNFRGTYTTFLGFQTEVPLFAACEKRFDTQIV